MSTGRRVALGLIFLELTGTMPGMAATGGTGTATEIRYSPAVPEAQTSGGQQDGPAVVSTDLAALLRRSGELIGSSSHEDAKALAMAEKARAMLEAGGESVSAYYALGLSSMVLGDKTLATDCLRRAVELDGRFVPARVAWARACFSRANPEKTIALLREGLELLPNDPALTRALAEVLYAAGKNNDAIALFESLAAADPTDEAVRDWLLQLYIAAGDIPKADAGFKRLLAQGKIEKIDYQLHLADLYLNAGKLREARKCLQEARREQPDHPALAERFSRYYSAFAESAVDEKQFARAVLYWERALEFAPDDPRILRRLAFAHAQRGENEKALKCYRTVLESGADDPQLLVEMADTLVALRRPDVAAGLLDRALETARKRGDRDAVRILEQARAKLAGPVGDATRVSNVATEAN